MAFVMQIQRVQQDPWVAMSRTNLAVTDLKQLFGENPPVGGVIQTPKGNTWISIGNGALVAPGVSRIAMKNETDKNIGTIAGEIATTAENFFRNYGNAAAAYNVQGHVPIEDPLNVGTNEKIARELNRQTAEALNQNDATKALANIQMFSVKHMTTKDFGLWLEKHPESFQQLKDDILNIGCAEGDGKKKVYIELPKDFIEAVKGCTSPKQLSELLSSNDRKIYFPNRNQKTRSDATQSVYDEAREIKILPGRTNMTGENLVFEPAGGISSQRRTDNIQIQYVDWNGQTKTIDLRLGNQTGSGYELTDQNGNPINTEKMLEKTLGKFRIMVQGMEIGRAERIVAGQTTNHGFDTGTEKYYRDQLKTRQDAINKAMTKDFESGMELTDAQKADKEFMWGNFMAWMKDKNVSFMPTQGEETAGETHMRIFFKLAYAFKIIGEPNQQQTMEQQMAILEQRQQALVDFTKMMGARIGDERDGSWRFNNRKMEPLSEIMKQLTPQQAATLLRKCEEEGVADDEHYKECGPARYIGSLIGTYMGPISDLDKKTIHAVFELIDKEAGRAALRTFESLDSIIEGCVGEPQIRLPGPSWWTH